MSLWGATAGVATLVGPLVGGLLVDGPGWEWIFFINVPVGLVGLVLAWRLVPRLETHSHSFDLIGVALSSIGMFCLVFGIQEGETYDWGTITGFLSVPLLIGVRRWSCWESSSGGRATCGRSRWCRCHCSATATSRCPTRRSPPSGSPSPRMAFPFMLFTQAVLGYSPTKSALLLVPMAVLSGALAPVVGRFVDTVHPRYITTAGLLLCSISLFWVSRLMTPNVAFWQLLLPMALLGVANAGMWAPLAATATRNLPMRSAGAGAGIYNTTRQVGAVLGSAAIAAVIEARLVANLGRDGRVRRDPGRAAAGGTGGSGLPPQVASGFASAMSEAILLPAAILLLGVVAALFFVEAELRREAGRGCSGRADGCRVSAGGRGARGHPGLMPQGSVRPAEPTSPRPRPQPR